MTDAERRAFELGAAMMREQLGELVDAEALFCLNMQNEQRVLVDGPRDQISYSTYWNLAVGNTTNLAERVFHHPLPQPPVDDADLL